MTLFRRTLQVFPDAGRRQSALRAGRGASGFALGRDLLTWEDFVGALGGARELNRRPCSALTARTVVSSLAQELGATPFGDFVREPAFARAALDLLMDLKAGRLSPRELQDAADVLAPSGGPGDGCSPACMTGTSSAWRSWGWRTARTCCGARARPWRAGPGRRAGTT